MRPARTILAALVAFLALTGFATVASAQIGKADRLAGKPAPTSAAPTADLSEARALYTALAGTVSARKPPCLTAADAGQLQAIAGLLDGVRDYIDQIEPGWTGSGFPTHGDIPDHGAASPAEARLDGLKAGYWALRSKIEALARLPSCEAPQPAPQPQTPGALPTPAPAPGLTTTPQSTGAGGVPTPPTPDPEPDPSRPKPPPATKCLTPEDKTYINNAVDELAKALITRSGEYRSLAEYMAALDATKQPGDTSSAADVRTIEQEITDQTNKIAALDANISALRADLAIERGKPACPEDEPSSYTPPAGTDNPFTPPTLPDPPLDPCRGPADDVYEAELAKIKTDAEAQRAALQAEVAPLEQQYADLVAQANAAASAKDPDAAVVAALHSQAADVKRSADHLEDNIEVLDAAIADIDERLAHPKPVCPEAGVKQRARSPAAALDDGSQTGGAATTPGVPAPAPLNDAPKDGGQPMQGGEKDIGVRVAPRVQPNRGATEGDQPSGESGGGHDSGQPK